MRSWVEYPGAAIAAGLFAGATVLFALELLRARRIPDRSMVRRWLAFATMWWATVAGLVVRQGAHQESHGTTTDRRSDDAAASALAAGLVAHVLTRRREQMRNGCAPERPSESEMRSLSIFARRARECRGPVPDIDLSTSQDPEVRSVLDAVERSAAMPSPHPVVAEWSAVLRVYGRPRVETRAGETIGYRKSRALELTAWLAFNRDRCSRSAARTAMWDIDVSDATFSTVVSDLRRALSSTDGTMSADPWVPATYNDEIRLSDRLTTDADLLRAAFIDFEASPRVDAELFTVLGGIRDVPFAGTRWSWADLDGTTTRLVILAVDASVAAARFACSVGRADLLDVAVRAGLRVMPGCPELMEIQQTFLSCVSKSR